MGVVADRVADVQILDLGDGDDVAGDGLVDRLLRLALHEEQAAAARRFAGAQIEERLLAVDLAGKDAEEAQVADELVGQRLEDLADELADSVGSIVDLVGLVAGALDGRALLALHRRQGEVG